MLKRHLLPASRLLAVSSVLVLGSSAALAGESAGNDVPPASPEALAQQSLLLFFGAAILAVSGLGGKGAISSQATVRLLGGTIVLGTSVFLAYSQLDSGRLMPVVAMLGVCLGLFFSKTEGAEPGKREQSAHLATLPATNASPEPNPTSNGHVPAGTCASRGRESEENSDASSSSSL